MHNSPQQAVFNLKVTMGQGVSLAPSGFFIVIEP
jgi:hypothetical protein